jgi:hypothetical protein
MAAANVNMRFTKTNDLLSSNFVSADPLGFEFGYTNLVFVRAGGQFQNIEQLDNTEK